MAVATKVLIKATPSAEPSCWKTLLSAPAVPARRLLPRAGPPGLAVPPGNSELELD